MLQIRVCPSSPPVAKRVPSGCTSTVHSFFSLCCCCLSCCCCALAPSPSDWRVSVCVCVRARARASVNRSVSWAALLATGVHHKRQGGEGDVAGLHWPPRVKMSLRHITPVTSPSLPRTHNKSREKWAAFSSNTTSPSPSRWPTRSSAYAFPLFAWIFYLWGLICLLFSCAQIKYGEIIELLLAAGYFRARIASLSPFDRVIGGVGSDQQRGGRRRRRRVCGEQLDWPAHVRPLLILSWLNPCLLFLPSTISEKIIRALPRLKCPHALEPHQVPASLSSELTSPCPLFRSRVSTSRRSSRSCNGW